MNKFFAKGMRYVDRDKGATIDFYLPDTESSTRSCLAVKYGIIRNEVFELEIAVQAPIRTTEDAYLRLQLLSRRTVKPNEISLEGLFENLPNIAWTSAGPVFPSRVGELRSVVAQEHHNLTVFSVDKFPRMLDYVIPDGVRVGDGDRVRLGAHLATGTTVMHEGFVNFNAGSLGHCMIEGRVTPGVVVGEGSDIGAGSSIMGTLSGGGKLRNQVGRGSLLGANAGIGISLGDNCVIEAGLYVTAGTKVTLPDGSVKSARELSGVNNLIFRRNSVTGAVEALVQLGASWSGLNAKLHAQE